ncbi:MAG TPA: hypothetical protein VHK47_11415 [Polyangia bacterium]|nr:hypothetical protein [Polyangia bacterium]
MPGIAFGHPVTEAGEYAPFEGENTNKEQEMKMSTENFQPLKMSARAAEICALRGISKETCDRAMANLNRAREKRHAELYGTEPEPMALSGKPIALSGSAAGAEPLTMSAKAAEICGRLGIPKETADRAMANLNKARERRRAGI